MCDPVSATVGLISVAASIGMGAKNAHDQRKAAKEAQKVQEQAEARQKAVLEAKGHEAVKSVDTQAADAERKRRSAVANNTNVFTSRQGALGAPVTASTSLGTMGTRTTMG